MSSIVINSEGLEQEIEVFEQSKEKIREIFESEVKKLLILNNGHSWVGKTQETVYNKQIEFQKNFEPILEALEVFINHMKKALDDYKRFEKQRTTNLEDNSSTLNVNSEVNE